MTEGNNKKKVNFEINKEENLISTSINTKIFPVDIILSAAYIFTTDNYVLIDGDTENIIYVELKPKKNGAIELESLAMEFNNELVNYTNYAIQAVKNSTMREELLKRILLTNTVDPNMASEKDEWENEFNDEDLASAEDIEEFEDFIDDPDGIATPWEEKNDEKNSDK